MCIYVGVHKRSEAVWGSIKYNEMRQDIEYTSQLTTIIKKPELPTKQSLRGYETHRGLTAGIKSTTERNTANRIMPFAIHTDLVTAKPMSSDTNSFSF